MPYKKMAYYRNTYIKRNKKRPPFGERSLVAPQYRGISLNNKCKY